MIYLDNSASTPLLPEVRTKMLAVMEQQASGEISNASSLHASGQRAHRLVEVAREQVAQLIGASPEEIIFVSGGSEANNTVAHVFANQNIAVSSIEHPSMLESARYYASNLTLVPVDHSGLIDIDAKNSKDKNLFMHLENTQLISIMLANNELGTIEPVREFSHKYRTSRTFIHSDATQAVGKIPVNVDDLGVDYLTLSAHKIGGPIGVGALYVRKTAPYHSLILGGHQENRRRAGTSNVTAIVGFGEAARLARQNLPKYKHVAKLRDDLRNRILNEIPHAEINSPAQHCLPNLLNASFAAAEGESIQLYLDAHGIIVSTGSACAAGDLNPSHVLMATHHDAERAHSSIRFSLGLNTTKQNLDEVMKVLPNIIRKLQGISTVKIAK